MYKVFEVTPERLTGLVLGQLCTSHTDYENVHQRMLLLAKTCALRKENQIVSSPNFILSDFIVHSTA